MLHKAWNSKGEVPYCFLRSSIKFQGHTGQNITDFDPNWAFPDYRPVAAFKSLRFALFNYVSEIPAYPSRCCCHSWNPSETQNLTTFCVSVTFVYVVESFWNFAQTMAVALLWSVQNFKMIEHLNAEVQALWNFVRFEFKMHFGQISSFAVHDDVIKWKHFPRYWPFVRGIHRSPVKSPHKGQWRGALMFTLICARING